MSHFVSGRWSCHSEMAHIIQEEAELTGRNVMAEIKIMQSQKNIFQQNQINVKDIKCWASWYQTPGAVPFTCPPPLSLSNIQLLRQRHLPLRRAVHTYIIISFIFSSTHVHYCVGASVMISFHCSTSNLHLSLSLSIF